MDERIRVLHAEDNRDFADLAATFLEREDDRFTVETASDAEEGMAMLGETEYHCVVSDFDMPGQNGIEFLESVRDRYPDLPFILFTGKGSEAVASDAISAGVTDYLQKEQGTDQYAILANRIRNSVERTLAERERRRHLDAIETAQEGISILDDDGVFIYVNEAYADLYGYEPDEMVGEHWTLTYRDSDVDQVIEEIVSQVWDEGYWHGETVGLRADGSTFVEDHTLATTDEANWSVRSGTSPTSENASGYSKPSSTTRTRLSES
jgi:PAS domain S-box-containing protein